MRFQSLGAAFLIGITSVAIGQDSPPNFAERINDFYLQWQQLPETRSYWVHNVMDSKGPGPDRDVWFEYVYRVTLTNGPAMGNRVRVDGLRSQFHHGALVDKVHDLVLLGKHLSLLNTSPGYKMDIVGVQTSVLDPNDKDSVSKRPTSLYALDPFWTALGTYTTVKSGQAIEYKIKTWSEMVVIEESVSEGGYSVLISTPTGKSACEVIFSNSKEHCWAPIEIRTYSNTNGRVKLNSPDSITRKDIEKFELVSHTKTQWQEVESGERKLYLPKKYAMYQSLAGGQKKLDVVLELGGWKFGKDVPSELFSEDAFLETCNDFDLGEGRKLFGLDGKPSSKK